MKLHRKCPKLLALCVALSLPACTKKNENSGPALRVLTYSTLGSKNGFLNSVKAQFESESKCALSIESTLGAAQVLSYLDEEKQRARIDVVMGVDQLLFERAKSAFYLADPANVAMNEIFAPILKSSQTPGFIPIDYGALSFIYRKSDLKGKTLPKNLSDILKPEFKGKWIVQDPRASSPGMLFFLFAQSTLVRIYDLKKQWATLAPSWDSSYKMFMSHESSMVWSYLTSLAYHASKGDFDQYGYLDFKEGLPLQVEGMAVLNRVGNPYQVNPCLQKWVEFVLKPEIQTKLADKQYMMPAVQKAALPKFFDKIPVISKAATLEFSAEKADELINHFGREVQGESP